MEAGEGARSLKGWRWRSSLTMHYEDRITRPGTSRHASAMVRYTSVRLLASLRAGLLLAVLASALTLASPAAASGQSISGERALLNRSSTPTVHLSVGQLVRSSMTAQPGSPSGLQALLGSSGANVELRGAGQFTERPVIRPLLNGEEALIHRHRLAAARSSGSER